MRPVVVITGASGGVGRACVQAFADRGCDIALIARGEAGLAAAAADVESRGGRALQLPADVSDWRLVDAAAEQVEGELGPIEVWVNAAFSSVFASFVDITAEEFARATEVTYLGFVNGTRAALRHMLPRDRGVVVHVGSALAYRGIPLQSAYCAAKHATQGFHESLRCELLHARSGVRTTMVQMPALNTPQFDWVRNKLPKRAQPVAPIFQPEVAARAVVHAAEHPSRREYWVGGSTALTLVANAIAPGLLDRYLARAGVQSQQGREPNRAEQDNLWHPVDSDVDHGAHGRFDRRSHGRSVQSWLSQHHVTSAAVLAGAGAAAVRALR